MIVMAKFAFLPKGASFEMSTTLLRFQRIVHPDEKLFLTLHVLKELIASGADLEELAVSRWRSHGDSMERPARNLIPRTVFASWLVELEGAKEVFLYCLRALLCEYVLFFRMLVVLVL